MAEFKLELGDWAQRLARQYELGAREVIPIMKMALYEGADIMANALRAAAKPYGLDAGVGVSKMEASADGANVSVGFRKEGSAGYFYNRFGQKTPYDLVVNVINSGTSKGRKGNHFFDNARDKAKPKAMAVMHDMYYEKIMKIIGE